MPACEWTPSADGRESVEKFVAVDASSQHGKFFLWHNVLVKEDALMKLGV